MICQLRSGSGDHSGPPDERKGRGLDFGAARKRLSDFPPSPAHLLASLDNVHAVTRDSTPTASRIIAWGWRVAATPGTGPAPRATLEGLRRGGRHAGGSLQRPGETNRMDQKRHASGTPLGVRTTATLSWGRGWRPGLAPQPQAVIRIPLRGNHANGVAQDSPGLTRSGYPRGRARHPAPP
jgi:hypothetical protein